MKNFKKAKESYLKAIELEPNYSDAIYNMGLVHTELREYNDAIECFKKIIEVIENLPQNTTSGKLRRELKQSGLWR